MNLQQFERQVGALQAQVSALWPSAGLQAIVLPPPIADSFADLARALAELQAADAEIRQQSNELVRQQNVLEAARQHWQDLFDLAPDGYLVTDLNGIVLEANRSATQLLSISPAELLGAPLIALVTPPARRSFLGSLAASRAGAEAGPGSAAAAARQAGSHGQCDGGAHLRH